MIPFLWDDKCEGRRAHKPELSLTVPSVANRRATGAFRDRFLLNRQLFEVRSSD